MAHGYRSHLGTCATVVPDSPEPVGAAQTVQPHGPGAVVAVEKHHHGKPAHCGRQGDASEEGGVLQDGAGAKVVTDVHKGLWRGSQVFQAQVGAVNLPKGPKHTSYTTRIRPTTHTAHESRRGKERPVRSTDSYQHVALGLVQVRQRRDAADVGPSLQMEDPRHARDPGSPAPCSSSPRCTAS
jgi:hypothetical protein